jgi:hypothetical protein
MPLNQQVLRSSMVSRPEKIRCVNERYCRTYFSSVYIVSLYQNLGLTGGVPLILGAAYVTVATISNFVGALLLDKVGRKPLLRKFCIPLKSFCFV